MKLLRFPRCYSHFIFSIFGGFLGGLIFYLVLTVFSHIPNFTQNFYINYRQRLECTCVRPELPHVSSGYLINEHHPSFCSYYSSRRGNNQRVISISLFGPKEVRKFQILPTLSYLQRLIKDLDKIYPDDFILRIYHDDTINATDVICPIECKHSNVDFCNMQSKTFIPPKIWRFIPAGDPLVDISMYIMLIS